MDVESYSPDDKELMWYTHGEQPPRLTLPRSLVSDILALVHLQSSHQGVRRTVALTRRYLFWPSPHRDTQDYVLSCGCCRCKRIRNARVAMPPANFLELWDVLEMDL
ncbi:unnamed protein product [Choristocarpus tenellus]